MSLDDQLEWAGLRVQVASARLQEAHDHWTRGRAEQRTVTVAKLEWERATHLLRTLQARRAVARAA
jgi:hypothetical protein